MIKSTTSIPDNDTLRTTFKEIDEKYQDQIKYLSDQRGKAEDMIVELKSKISSLETQLKVLADSTPVSQTLTAKAGSYEEALMEEMEKMKKGFERKITVLSE